MTMPSIRPLTGPSPAPAGAYDLAALGYAEEEFLLDGEAVSYAVAGERSAVGRWQAEPDQSASFTTRIVVRRPIDGFSGTVFVEWLNVSGGVDAPAIWMMTHTELMRRRHAWVGISAQRAGIDGGGLVESFHLKKLWPERYGVLSHPGDRWSLDIFSQAGRVVRSADVLGGLAPERLIAAGHSQSAAFLVTYINAIDALAPVYDAFAVHGRMNLGASLTDGFIPARLQTSTAGEQIRSDLRVPVLVLQTETDQALLGGGYIGQPDRSLLRQWELAGAAHADTYLLVASGLDDGRLAPAELARLTRPTTEVIVGTTDRPINSGLQHHYVACAALESLDTWARGGAAPPAAPRLDLEGQDFRRDGNGIALGGIRTPWTDVPTAALSGVGQSGAGLFSFLFGVTRPFTASELAALYPGGLADYLERFAASLDQAITVGFMLADDRAEALATAEAAWPGLRQ
jgi:Alpha/beta hydrolase domain